LETEEFDMITYCLGNDGAEHVELECDDFLPPKDDRMYVSGIEDMPFEAGFGWYAKYFWEFYENDIDC